MSVIKGRISDISPEFLLRLELTFPESSAVFVPGRGLTFEELAYQAGAAFVVKWIKQHANQTTSTR